MRILKITIDSLGSRIFDLTNKSLNRDMEPYLFISLNRNHSEFNTHTIELVKCAKHIICADSGFEGILPLLTNNDINPSAVTIVGDMDSLSNRAISVSNDFGIEIVPGINQDNCDFSKSLNYCLTQFKYKSVVALAPKHIRIDHLTSFHQTTY